MGVNLNLGINAGTMCFSKAGLAIGSTTTQLAIAAPNGAGVDFAVKGVMYHRADVATLDPGTAAQQADLTTCIYLVSLTAAATPLFSVVKGTEQVTATMTAEYDSLEWPTPAENTCPIGYFKVVTSGTTFTLGTTDLNDANVTTTYVDLCAVPVERLTS